MINIGAVPPAVVTVPVRVEDVATQLEYFTTMVAGIMGVIAMTVAKDQSSVQPRSGWMLEDSVEPLRSRDGARNTSSVPLTLELMVKEIKS